MYMSSPLIKIFPSEFYGPSRFTRQILYTFSGLAFIRTRKNKGESYILYRKGITFHG
jgi:hypothetical protein